MKKLLLILSTLLIGCSLQTNTVSLNDSFNEYKSSLETSSEKTFLTDEVWNDLVTARDSSKQSAFVHSLAEFPTEMLKITDIKQSIQDEKGCLLVSGSNNNDVELDYYISYSLVTNNWIINEVSVKYFLDDSERYLKEAECDKEKRMNLWLQFIENT